MGTGGERLCKCDGRQSAARVEGRSPLLPSAAEEADVGKRVGLWHRRSRRARDAQQDLVSRSETTPSSFLKEGRRLHSQSS
jgi:hypothetical protein